MIAIVALQNCGLSQERAYTPQETEQLKQAKEDSQKLIRFYEEGQYERAIKLGQGVLKIQGKVLGAEHFDYTDTLNTLAALHAKMGAYARAEPLYLEAKKIDAKVFGTEHPDYANTLNNLAALYFNMGDCARAEPLFLEAKKISAEVRGQPLVLTG